MHRTDAFGHSAGFYTEGNPGTGTPATRIGAKHLNAIQEELCRFVELAGLALDDVDNEQVWAAVQQLLALKAPLNSPALTGTPTGPTAAPGTDSTQLATTAFVAAAIASLLNSAPGALDTLNELATALGNDPNFATTVTNALSLKAPLNSPVFTGNPQAVTQDPGTDDATLATTAFVAAAIAALDALVVKLSGDQSIAGVKTHSARPRVPALHEAVNALGNVSGAQDVDLAAGGVITATVTGAWEPTFINPPGSGYSQGVVLRITNGGAGAITWPGVNWAAGVAPALAVSGVDEIALLFIGDSVIDGAYIGRVG